VSRASAPFAAAWAIAVASVATRADILGDDPSLKNRIASPMPGRFSVCCQHTCSQVDHPSLSARQWAGLRAIFRSRPSSPNDERTRIARAIAYLEIEVGRHVGTSGDRGGNYEGLFAGGKQLDCVGEATNTTTYLQMIEGDGLPRFHGVDRPATRARSSRFIIGWPHSTAVIRETGTGEEWAVDSSFFDNGQPPVIVPLSFWRTGWSPDQ
jgi:hypothetical protein